MYHTEPPTDKTIREWYMNSSIVAACALRIEQAVRACGPVRPVRHVRYPEYMNLFGHESLGSIKYGGCND